MMKQRLSLTFLFLTLVFLSTAQIQFKEGYIINNRNERIDCQIRNLGREESTIHYEYRLGESGDFEKIELSKFVEFGVENELKCIRAFVPIDMSPDRITSVEDTLSVWEEGHAFLSVLLEGELATLFAYHDLGKDFFFYRLEGSDIVPLIYKKYEVGVSPNFVQRRIYNNTFREQLALHLACGNQNKAEKISYTKKDLVTYFEKYHQCKKKDYKTFESSRTKKGLLLLKPKVGLNSIQLKIKDPIDAAPMAYFSKENSVGFGVEVEYIFPYNNYQWGLFVESNHLSYKSVSVTVNNEVNPDMYKDYMIDYQSIEFPFGLIYHLTLDKNNRFFAKAAYVPHIIFSSSYIAFNATEENKFSSHSSLLFGIGYNHRGLGVEFKYYTPANITQNLYKRGSNLNQLSFNLFYTFQLLGDQGFR